MPYIFNFLHLIVFKYKGAAAPSDPSTYDSSKIILFGLYRKIIKISIYLFSKEEIFTDSLFSRSR